MLFVAFKAGFVEGYHRMNGKLTVDLTRDVRKAMTFDCVRDADRLAAQCPQLGYYALLSAQFEPN